MKMAKIFDGWSNILTGLGVQNKDKRTGATVVSNFISQADAESMYQTDDIAAKLIDKIPEEALREGFEVYADGENMTETIQEVFEKFDLYKKIEQAWKWARLYGGAGLIIGANDGVTSSAPLNIRGINGLQYFAVLDRWRLVPAAGDQVDKDISSSNFGLPVSYSLQNAQIGDGSQPQIKIHQSRIIRFEGFEVPYNLKASVQYWGDSVLSKLMEVIRDYQISYHSAALIMQDFTQLIVKLKGLADMIASGDDNLVQRRLALLASTASIVNAVVIQEDEECERKTTTVTGLPEMLKAMDGRLVTACDVPHTIILGDSPSGLGATGDSENRDWYDFIKKKQESFLRPILKKILSIIFADKQGPTKGVVPKKFTVEFCPLWQMSETETVQNRKTMAEADNIYIQAGVLDPKEVADSRFGGEKYSIETELNSEVRAAMAEVEIQEPEESEMEGEPDAVQPAN